jgi:hypothetical protein
MGTPTYQPIGSVTATGTTTSITFTSIGSYRDYIVQGNTVKGGTGYWAFRFNDDTVSSNPLIYSLTFESGSITSGTASTTGHTYAGNIAGGLTTVMAHIMDASATDKHKTVLGRFSNMGRPEVGISAANWPNTAAVTSITVLNPSSTFDSGTTISLYGIIA